MSLSVALNTALTGLLINQRSVQTAATNVSNAQTEGYSRQVVNRESLALAGFGGGVRIASITRAADQFLIKEHRLQLSGLGQLGVGQRYFAQTQDLFGTPGNSTSLGARLTELGQRLQAMSLEPESGARRTSVIDSAVILARNLNQLSDSVQGLRLQAEREIGAAVADINTALRDIADFNRAIARGLSTGQTVSEIQDQRDRALDKLAGYIGINHFTRSNGEIVVYSEGGQSLVDSDPVQLTYSPATMVSVNTTFADITINGQPVTTSILSGSLRGLLDMRDTTLPDLQTQLDALAVQLRDQVNLAHNRGAALPPVPTLNGTRNFADITVDQVTLSDPARIAVVDANGVITAHVDVAAGTYTVQQVRDAINAGLAGFATASAANGDGLDIAATAAGSGIAIVDLVAGGGDAAVTYDDGTTVTSHRGFSNFFGLNDLFVAPPVVAGDPDAGVSGTIAVRSDVVADPARLARGRLYDSTATLPVAGTTVGLTPGDNRVALDLATTFDSPVVFAAVGGLPSMATSLAGFANEILGRNASLTADNGDRQGLQQSLVNDLASRQAETSGVNVDEEIANMLAFQNAYAASARVISVVSEMLDTLLQLR